MKMFFLLKHALGRQPAVYFCTVKTTATTTPAPAPTPTPAPTVIIS